MKNLSNDFAFWRIVQPRLCIELDSLHKSFERYKQKESKSLCSSKSFCHVKFVTNLFPEYLSFLDEIPNILSYNEKNKDMDKYLGVINITLMNTIDDIDVNYHFDVLIYFNDEWELIFSIKENTFPPTKNIGVINLRPIDFDSQIIGSLKEITKFLSE